MPSLALLGLQWGDEGKGKIIDVLAQKADIIARYQGGPNAGHTVYWRNPLHARENEASIRFAFHLVPSGILNPKTVCVIGRGCVVDLAVLRDELAQLTKVNIDYKNRLFIDSKAHLILPYHKAIDRLREEAKGKDKIGTTVRGIGPCYEDKIARIGIRFGDLKNEEIFNEKLKHNLAQKNFLMMELYKAEPLSEKEISAEFLQFAEFFSNMYIDGADYLNTAYENEKKILFEGAQGTLLDIDHGTYPFVTSSSPTAGGICTGTGVGPTRIDDIIGVAKAYTTRVGMGPFPTELFDDSGIMLQTQGSEFGATTGRARRCGWFDAPLVRYTTRVNGIKQLAITKLDVLDKFQDIYIGCGYNYKDEKISNFDPDLTSELKPEYLKFEGWQSSTKTAKAINDLPKLARKYLEKIEELTDCQILILSVGEQREETIVSPDFNW